MLVCRGAHKAARLEEIALPAVSHCSPSPCGTRESVQNLLLPSQGWDAEGYSLQGRSCSSVWVGRTGVWASTALPAGTEAPKMGKKRKKSL